MYDDVYSEYCDLYANDDNNSPLKSTLEKILELHFKGLSKEEIIIALRAYYPEHFI